MIDNFVYPVIQDGDLNTGFKPQFCVIEYRKSSVGRYRWGVILNGRGRKTPFSNWNGTNFTLDNLVIITFASDRHLNCEGLNEMGVVEYPLWAFAIDPYEISETDCSISGEKIKPVSIKVRLGAIWP
jgi:hypothetical protein